MLRVAILGVITCVGCANNNVAELAARVRIVDDPAVAQTCRWVGTVSGRGMTLTGARQQAQRRALYLGANLIVAGGQGRVVARMINVNGGHYANINDYSASLNGMVYDCAQEGSLAHALTGVTFVP